MVNAKVGDQIAKAVPRRALLLLQGVADGFDLGLAD